MKEIEAILQSRNYGDAFDVILRRAMEPLALPQLEKLTKYMAVLPKTVIEGRGFLIKKIVLLGGYPTSALAMAIRVRALQQRIWLEVLTLPDGTFETVIFGGNQAIKGFAPDLIFLCVGWEHIQFNNLESEIERWSSLWYSAFGHFGAEIIQTNIVRPDWRPCGNYEIRDPKSRERFILKFNLALADRAPDFVHILDVDHVSTIRGLYNWFDPRDALLTGSPVAPGLMVEYADALARVIGGLFGRSKRVLILDLDNTIWGGVVGDDGISGIEVGFDTATARAFFVFQDFLRRLQERGVLLAISSRNELGTVKQAFAEREEMPLRFEHFAYVACNWGSKVDQIIEIATQLNQGLENCVFVDDNPAERERVRTALREVSILELPEDPAYYVRSLASSGHFEVIALSQEDRNRSLNGGLVLERSKLLAGSPSREEFLQGLKMEAEIGEPQESHLPRMAQLLNKTNQFNLTGRQYSVANLTTFKEQKNFTLIYVKLSDKFGSYGLISALVLKFSGDGGFGPTATIDNWVMSCRVFDRDLELAIFSFLVQFCRKRGVVKLTGEFIQSGKNRYSADLYSRLGFQLTEDKDKRSVWIYDLANLPVSGAVIEIVAPMFKDNAKDSGRST